MKIVQIALVAAALSFQSMELSAQIDRTKPPAPTAAPTINIPDANTFTLPNGLKVIVVQNTKVPSVSATLSLDRMPLLEGKKAGYTSIAGELLRSGTTTKTKAVLDEAIDFLGASINAGSTSVSASSVTKFFPQTLALMADVALRPSFPVSEFERIKSQTLSGLESQKDDPGSIATNVTNALVYSTKHPYGEPATPETVKSVTLTDIKNYYKTYWKPNIAYLVFVGDITPAKAKALATQYFGKWAKGVVPKSVIPAVKQPTENIVAIVDRPTAVQSSIRIANPVDIKPGAPDAIPSSLLNTMLGGGFSSRLMQNLREKHGFTYGARSGLATDRYIGNFNAFAEVRNDKTDSAVGQFLYEINRIGTEMPDAEEVLNQKTYQAGGFARSLESPETIAQFALNRALYNLPADYYKNYLKTLQGITPNRVNEVASKYISNTPKYIIVVGKASEIAPGLEKYGKLQYYDMYGNPVAAPEFKKVAAGVTGESILQKALEAYGTEAARNAIKDLTLTGEVDIMGQKLAYVQKNIAPDDMSSVVSMAGMTVMKQMKSGDNYVMQMQGNNMPINEQAKEEIKSRAQIFSEAGQLNDKSISYEVTGIEKANGEDAYAVKSIKNGKAVATDYYSVASGLKVMSVAEQEGPMGKVSVTSLLGGYKEVGGIKWPTTITVDMGNFKQNIVINDIKVNTGLKQSDL